MARDYDGPMAAQATMRPRADYDDRAKALKSVSLPLDELARSLENIRERILAQTRQVEQLADSLLGTEAKAPGNLLEGTAVGPPSMGRVHSLNDAAGYINNCLSGLQYQLDRLGVLTG